MSSISVLSWNILAPMWVHPSHFPETDMKIFESSVRRKLIYSGLHKLARQADIICLQEVQGSELQQPDGFVQLESDFDIADLSNNEPTCWANWLIDQPMQDNGTLVLLRKGKFKDVNVSRVVISEDGNAATVVTCKLNGKNVIIVNSHMDTDTQDRRSRQAAKILSIFDEFCGRHRRSSNGNLNSQDTNIDGIPHNIPMDTNSIQIWAGDFNMESNNSIIKDLISHGWRDLMKEQKLDHPTVCSSKENARRIDYLFCKGENIVTGGFVPEVPSRKNPPQLCTWAISKLGSDHIPIIASLLL